MPSTYTTCTSCLERVVQEQKPWFEIQSKTYYENDLRPRRRSILCISRFRMDDNQLAWKRDATRGRIDSLCSHNSRNGRRGKRLALGASVRVHSADNCDTRHRCWSCVCVCVVACDNLFSTWALTTQTVSVWVPPTFIRLIAFDVCRKSNRIMPRGDLLCFTICDRQASIIREIYHLFQILMDYE